MIPYFRPTLPPLREYQELLEEVWQSRMLSNFGPFSSRLEETARRYLGVDHVRAVVSGDIGLVLALKALDLPRGAPCYLSTFTFNSTINAALWAGFSPVLVDAEIETYNMSLRSLEQALDGYPGEGVILATHVFGNPCPVSDLENLARERGCFLAFDAAHAYGSRVGDAQIGCFGDVEVFSLSGTKLVTSAEGGLIASRHDWLVERITYLRAYGFQNDYYSKFVGLNGKISELHCALASLSLHRIEEAVARRCEILEGYRRILGDSVGWQTVEPGTRSTYKDISVKVGACLPAVMHAMKQRGIEVKRYFVPLHLMAPYRDFARIPLSVSEELYESTLCLPAFDDLSDVQVEEVCDALLGVLT